MDLAKDSESMMKRHTFRQISDPSSPIAECDIVFIHGLHDRSEQTWRGVKGLFWPQDLLPRDFPSARVFTFGFSVVDSVDELAEDVPSALFQHLEKLEQNNEVGENTFLEYTMTEIYSADRVKPDRPLIIIAHSLGGLIVQHALLFGFRQKQPHTLSRLEGVVFLGTPGFDEVKAWSGFCSIISEIYQPSRELSSPEIMNLCRLSCDFRKRYQDSKLLDKRICYGYETLSTRQYGILVPYQADVDDSNNSLRLYCRHSDLAECNGPRESQYQLICEKIKSFLGQDAQASRKPASKPPRSPDGREAILEEIKSEEVNTIRTTVRFGLNLDDQGHSRSAEEKFEQVLREWPVDKSKELTPVDLSKTKVSLFCQGKISCILRGRGQYKEAETLSRNVLQGMSEVLGSGHELTLQCIRDLALNLMAQQRLQESFNLLRDTLEKEAGDPYQTVAQARLVSVLSILLKDLGHLELAIVLARNVVDTFENLLGDDHPFTLVRASDLAELLAHDGQYHLAEAIHRKALDSLQKMLGTDYHPAMRVARKLADVLRFREDLFAANDLYRRTHDLQLRELGSSHPESIATACGITAVQALTEGLRGAEDRLLEWETLHGNLECNDHNHQWVEEGLLIVRAILYNDDPKSIDEEVNRSSNALAFFRSPWRPKLQASQWLEIDALLLKDGHDDRAGGFSGTALHAACFHGDLSTFHRLLSSSHNTGTPNARAGIFGTPLQAAIIGQQIHIVKTLLHAGADPNEDTYPGSTPIQTALITNTLIIQTLIARSAYLNNPSPYFGTPLQEASLAGQSPTVGFLLKGGANPDIRAGFFDTALRAAAYSGDPQTVRLLLRSSSKTTVRWDGREALRVAEERGCEAVVGVLREGGVTR